jgi:hypothetical protein
MCACQGWSDFVSDPQKTLAAARATPYGPVSPEA